MNRNVKYIWHGITYGELKSIIADSQGIRSFPLLGDTGKQILSLHQGQYSSHFSFFPIQNRKFCLAPFNG